MFVIVQTRTYKKDHTVSTLRMPNGEIFSVLEDIGRPIGVKVMHETCIPEGLYKVEVDYSNRFARKLPLLFNKKDGSIDRDGIQFTGIRVHGGNTVEDTSGCLLVGKHYDGNKVYDCHYAVHTVTDFINNNKCLWAITSEGYL